MKIFIALVFITHCTCAMEKTITIRNWYQESNIVMIQNCTSEDTIKIRINSGSHFLYKNDWRVLISDTFVLTKQEEVVDVGRFPFLLLIRGDHSCGKKCKFEIESYPDDFFNLDIDIPAYHTCKRTIADRYLVRAYHPTVKSWYNKLSDKFCNIKTVFEIRTKTHCSIL